MPCAIGICARTADLPAFLYPRLKPGGYAQETPAGVGVLPIAPVETQGLASLPSGGGG